RHAVVATAEKDVAVYDIDSGARVRSLELPKEQVSIDSRFGPAVSGDGRRAALAEASFDESFALDGVKLAVADIASGETVLAPMELDWPLSSITMSHDGELIAAIDEGGVVRLIDVESGLTRIVSGTVAHEPQQNSARAGVVRFTNDGRLVYGTVEGPLLLIDPDAAVVVGAVPMPAESANVAMVILDDTRVVTTGDRRISFVDLATGRVEWSQEFSTTLNEPCSWIAASVELDTVYCGDQWGEIAERTLTTGAPTDRSFDPQLGYVGAMSVVGDGRELVVVGRGNPAITRWKLDGSGAVTRLLAPGWSTQDGYSPTGSSIVVARRTEDMRSGEDYREFAVLDTRSGEITLRLPTPAYGIRWAGEDMLLGDVGGVGPEYARHVDARTGRTFAADLTWDSNGVWMSANGKRLYFSYEGGDIWTVEPATGRRIEPTLHTQEGGGPGNISTNPDGSRVLVTNWADSTISSMLFDGDTGKRLKTGLEGSPWTVLTARGEIVAATNNRIVRYDADTFERIGSLPGVSGGIDTISVSPDGRTLSVYAMNETVSVYDLVAGIRLGDPISVSSEWTFSGVFSADGGEMAVNVPAGIAVWDLKTSSQAEAACSMAGRDLTRDEWNAYVGDLGPYRSTCGFGDG
ncbi:MAG TPA: WD40 repeat domain-containing protein, partial [Ilumatobacteraceae bacterium]|nr:WD40 repeat domain-containing protein [Ilumatobacteraceae bacterium]